MSTRVSKQGYLIASSISNLVEQEIIPGLAIKADDFWRSLADIFDEFIPRNQKLIAFRNDLQLKIDHWHLDQKNQPFNAEKYHQFLIDIGYLIEEKTDFNITTENVDDEVAKIAAPQLVVPLMNARFALNAANARWGSLYDALYGTDVISPKGGAEQNLEYNPVRGKKVQAYARKFLDQVIPLAQASHVNSVRYFIEDCFDSVTNRSKNSRKLIVKFANGLHTELQNPQQFIGFNGSQQQPTRLLFLHHGLHIEIQFDENDTVAKSDPAKVKDIILEAALTTIQDCEDSIAAVDAEDKTIVYRHWLGLMKGDLTAKLIKKGRQITRQLNADRNYQDLNNQPFTLAGRSLLFIRNVGHLMTSDCVLTANGDEVPEGILDALMTCLISLHDLQQTTTISNSKNGNIYIVKPKMHGPEEVQFSVDLFSRIEKYFKLLPNTIKMGIMDEERRTSVNLKECIRAAKDRIAFINTGFLDRTGDELHTSMYAGAMTFKEKMKDEQWMTAYENQNVRIGLQAGFMGKAQIGKGMWAIPDQMSAMLKSKIEHPQAGANCAWVPSPTAATLHAIHYHQVEVSKRQKDLLQQYNQQAKNSSSLADLLTIPLMKNLDQPSQQAVQNELDNNVQGLLGYVVRWVNQGIGCSTVPDINHIGRMEDRATLRISSQHIGNWLQHKILSKQQVLDSLRSMAVMVDQQNINDKNYQPMANNFEQSIAFQAAVDLIFKAKEQPNGYTEPLLHNKRQQLKLEKRLG